MASDACEHYNFSTYVTFPEWLTDFVLHPHIYNIRDSLSLSMSNVWQTHKYVDHGALGRTIRLEV